MPMSDNEIVKGMCECGCGNPSPRAKRNEYSNGVLLYRKGEPMRYITQHNWHGKGPAYEIVDCGYQTPCWVWKRHINPDGYGQMTFIENGLQTTQRAHVVFYKRHKGPIPPGLQLDHLCKNPACVNPDHLEPVTPAENSWRSRKTVVTKAQAIAIANDTFHTGVELSQIYGVSTEVISRIRTGRSWGKLTGKEYTRRYNTAQWAVNYDCCRICKRTDRPHRGHGFCRYCYWLRSRGWVELVDEKPDTWRVRPREPKKRPWSRWSPVCLSCGTTRRPHGGRGLCDACYARYLRDKLPWPAIPS